MGASVVRFEVSLSQVDDGRYESLEFRLAIHPSETDLFTVTRALAYVLWYEEGMYVSPGICKGEDPPLSIVGLDGVPRLWIDIGNPSPDRVHKASLSHGRVRLLTWREPEAIRARLAAKVSHMDRVEVFGLPEPLVRELAETLDRRNDWSVTVTEGLVYVEAGGRSVQGGLQET